jgi:hypothetical protein
MSTQIATADFDESGFDPSQFKLQLDGTFKISIRAMAAMAGIDFSGLARSLRSVVDDNPLPLARSLLAQGFNPVDVSTWGATGGIPEQAAPYILEHYGIQADRPSAQARGVLLALSRVGINAYLKERLGVGGAAPAPQLTPEQQSLEWLMGFSQRWGIQLDDRDQLQIRNHAMSLALPAAGGQSVYNDIPISRAVFEQFRVQLPTKQLAKIGRAVARRFRTEFKTDPPQHDQYVEGANREVAHYDRKWLVEALRQIHDDDPSLFCRPKS